MDIVNLTAVCAQRARVMQSVQWDIRGPSGAALKVAMLEIVCQATAAITSEVRAARGCIAAVALDKEDDSIGNSSGR